MGEPADFLGETPVFFLTGVFFFVVPPLSIFFFDSIVPTKSMGGRGKVPVEVDKLPLYLPVPAMVFMDFMALTMPFSFGALDIL